MSSLKLARFIDISLSLSFSLLASLALRWDDNNNCYYYHEPTGEREIKHLLRGPIKFIVVALAERPGDIYLYIYTLPAPPGAYIYFIA